MAGEVRYRFRVKNQDGKELVSDPFVGPPHPVQVQTVLLDDNGDPHPDQPYTLTGGGVTRKGKSGAGGEVHEQLPAGTLTCELTATFHDDDHPTVWQISLTPPPPLDTIGGVQARLNQAGFHAGPITDAMNDQTRNALRELQHHHGIEPANGELNEETKHALQTLAEHDDA